MAGIQQGLIGSLYGAVGDFESIATVTASGSSPTLSFTSIPSTYTHLQIRGIAKTTTAGSGYNSVALTFNADSTSSYTRHLLYGTGASAYAYALAGTNTLWYIGGNDFPQAGLTNIFGAQIIDILDYANTNKYKTCRALSGVDANGAGEADFSSSVWIKTNAITSIELNASSGNFASGTTYALYGVK